MRVIGVVFIIISIFFMGCFHEGKKVICDCIDNNESETRANDPTFAPNSEPYFKFAWHLQPKENLSTLFTKTYFVEQNADLNIIDAWHITRGKGLKVAIIDDSFEPNHEDIKDNVIIAYDIDEDDYDLSNDTNGASHGHMCAGVLAANGNNKKGIVGIAPEVRLILIKQIETDDAKTIKAFEFAKENGAKVISCSWGSENVSQAVKEKIDELYEHNITIVFAFGNENISFDNSFIHDESELASVIGVGASNERNLVASYSNYGSNLDILAPAGEIGIPTIDKTGQVGDDNQLGFVNNNYTFFPGTSASTPLVAGTAALMLSVNNSLTPEQIRTILIQTADKIGSSYDNNGFNIKYGYGKINASKAVLKAMEL